MRLPSRLHAGLALASAALPISCGGCERRVEEPLPEVRPLTALAADEPRPPPKPWGKRCVRERAPTPRPTTPPSPDPRCPPDPEKPPALRAGKVTFGDAAATTITVEIAEKDHDRQRGLMYRKAMPADHGMIFWFEEKSDHSFWMHNTCIPLDMLYLDDDGLIVGIEENTPTLTDQTFDVGCESRYVLEVNAGFTRAHGIVPGQKVRVEGI
jgi:uncharacterized membrane protein (UPF0127 family)